MAHRATALVVAAAGLLSLPGSAGAQAGVSYLIPLDNPFVGQAGAAGEVWAYGLRNPFRFSFDRANGTLVMADVGAGAREEIDVLAPGQSGLNFGWPCREGDVAGPQVGNPGCSGAGFTEPVFAYPTPAGGAVIGGYVVRDAALVGLVGRYLYSDYSDGEIKSISLSGAPGPESTGADVGRAGSFGEDALGRLYATDVAGGGVYRLNSAGPGMLTTVKIDDFTAPTHVTAPPGDQSRLLVVEQRGLVRLILNGQPSQTPFLDIESMVGSGGERGFLSIAFAPDYDRSGNLYAFYTDTGGDLRVDEFKRGSDPDRIAPGTRRSVLTVEHSSAGNHNGGQLQFGPDGFLYISAGDGGNQGDPELDGQNRGSLLGKILRIDPDPATPGSSLPADRDPPRLSARAPALQRLLRLGGVVAYGRCDEPCTVTLSARLTARGHRFRLRQSTRSADAAGAQVRLRAGLTRQARRALRRALRRGRRPQARLSVEAVDAAGNFSAVARRLIRARR